MVVYVAKWIKKSTLIGMVGIMFAILGAITICNYFYLGYIKYEEGKDYDARQLYSKAIL